MNVLGLMSGSSLDGLDLALVRFTHNDNWSFELLAFGTEPLSQTALTAIENAYKGSALDLALAHKTIGTEFGFAAKKFLEEKNEMANLISSHGHTIFHRPDLGMTFQAGSGAEIATITGIDTVCDLRTTDMALGGQGAPLVPLGEKALFPEHRLFLNLGGIANISIHGEKISAFDICPCNMMLNFLAKEKDLPYDDNGTLARSGKLHQELFDRINAVLPSGSGQPHSLGREHFDKQLKPLLQNSALSTQNKLSTVVEVIATAIANVLGKASGETIMITGGGAFNSYLIERIEALGKAKTHIPDKTIVEFKEAIIFAFLGLLRLRNESNCSSDVTGARMDNIGGAIYAGNSH